MGKIFNATRVNLVRNRLYERSKGINTRAKPAKRARRANAGGTPPPNIYSWQFIAVLAAALGKGEKKK